MRYLMACITAVLIVGSVATDSIAGRKDRGRNITERARDRKEVQQGKKEMADDQRDLELLAKFTEEFAAAREANDEVALASVDAAVLQFLETDLAEATREAAKAKAEVRQGRRELRSDRQEVRENRENEEETIRKMGGRYDKRDDRRDLKDDRSDAASEAGRLDQLTTLRDDWSSVAGSFDTEALNRRAVMLTSLRSLSSAEVAGNLEEAKEDKAELREDRRESREDRRQED